MGHPLHIWTTPSVGGTTNGFMFPDSTIKVGVNSREHYSKHDRLENFVELEVMDIVHLNEHVQSYLQDMRIKLYSKFLSILRTLESNGECALSADLSEYSHTATLLDSYFSNKRSFHNFSHIFSVLNYLKEKQDEICLMLAISPTSIRFIAMQLALLFHDVVYTPEGSSKYQGDHPVVSNEKQSAELAICALEEIDIHHSIITEVYELILATDHYQFIPFDPKGRYCVENLKATVCDIDLRRLSVPLEQFQKDRMKVRREYPGVSMAEWEVGSIKFARHFLENRPSIYSTPAFMEYEEQARINLSSI